MVSERKLSANRKNSKNSSGPRSEIGKKRASRNAFKHGLATRVDETRGDDVERFCRALTNEPLALPYAREAAEATLEIVRIRRARVAILNQLQFDRSAQNLSVLVSAWRIDRYEKRALSRRKRAINNMLSVARRQI